MKLSYSSISALTILFQVIISLNCANPTMSKNITGIQKSELQGNWRITSWSVNSIWKTQPIAFDSLYSEDSFNQISIFNADSMVQYSEMNSTLCDTVPTLRTIRSHSSYRIGADTLYLEANIYTIRAKTVIKSDSLLLEIVIDSTNPMSNQYGNGVMIRRYVKYTGIVPPQKWASLCQ